MWRLSSLRSWALNMDETVWRTAGQRRAMWGAFTDRHAVVRVRESRHEDHANTLLGSTTAIVTSDRWWAYAHRPVKRRQVCRVHLRRDFTARAEGLAAEKASGEVGLKTGLPTAISSPVPNVCPHSHLVGECTVASSTAPVGNSSRPLPA